MPRHKTYATWPAKLIPLAQLLQHLAANEPTKLADLRRTDPQLAELLAMPLSARGPITREEMEEFGQHNDAQTQGPESDLAAWEVAFSKAAKKARGINRNLRPMLTADGPADEVVVNKGVGTFEAHVQSVDGFLFATEQPQEIPQEVLVETVKHVAGGFKSFLDETVAKMRKEKAGHETVVADLNQKIAELEKSQHVNNISIVVPEREVAILNEHHLDAGMIQVNAAPELADAVIEHPDGRKTKLTRRRL